MSRIVRKLAFLQVSAIVLGFIALAVVLKVLGYPDLDPTVRWNPLPVFLREHGGWLLVLPAAWIPFATISETRDRGIFSNRIAFLVGAAIPVVAIAFFIYASVDSYTRPLFLHR